MPQDFWTVIEGESLSQGDLLSECLVARFP